MQSFYVDSPGTSDSLYKCAPVHTAVFFDNTEVLKLLIQELEAEVDSPNFGETTNFGQPKNLLAI